LQKSLKEQNRWQFWLIVAGNTFVIYNLSRGAALSLSGFGEVFKEVSTIFPLGIALVFSTVLNGLLDANTKAQIVYLRWHFPLPGHRAFTEHAPRDPRIDLARLKKLHRGSLPIDPAEQNRVWYKFYKTVENTPAVSQVHRDFLLLRDYSSFAALLIVIFGALGFVLIPTWTIAFLYLFGLILQYIAARQAASNYGVRLVTTVLAQTSAASPEPKSS
jgi:hypothetical protein